MENYGELRAYFFQNMYLQGIHAGIQSQHTTVEMFLSYSKSKSQKAKMLYDWADNHKTTIILNGGYTSNLIKISALLKDKRNPLPWSDFCESTDALNGALTNVGVIVPEKYYSVKVVDACQWLDYTPWEIQFMEVLQSCRLMN